MDRHKYYERYDEKILVVASLLVATVVLFVLTFFLGCGKEGTHTGTLGSIRYTLPEGNMPGVIHEYTKKFTDDTTGTTVSIGWKTKCDSVGCINVSADVVLMENKNNCIIHALLPNDPQNVDFEKPHSMETTDVILAFELSSMINKELHVRHFHLYSDGNAEQF